MSINTFYKHPPGVNKLLRDLGNSRPSPTEVRATLTPDVDLGDAPSSPVGQMVVPHTHRRPSLDELDRSAL